MGPAAYRRVADATGWGVEKRRVLADATGDIQKLEQNASQPTCNQMRQIVLMVECVHE